MLPYLLLLIIVLFVIVLQEINIDVIVFKSKVSVLLLSISFIIFFSIRDYIGYDYPAYVTIIESQYWDMYLNSGEWLTTLCMLFAHEVEDYHVFFAIVSVISFTSLISSLNNNSFFSTSTGWGMLCFLAMPLGFIEGLSTSRQFVAMSIVLYSTKWLIGDNRSFGKFILGILVATGFHITSIISLLMYPISSLKFKYRYLPIILVGIVILGVFSFTILSKYMPILEIYSLRYLQEMKGGENGGSLQILMWIICAVIGIFFRRFGKKIPYYDMFLKCYLMGVGLVILVAPFSFNEAFRIGGAMLYCYMFLIPYFFSSIKLNQRCYIKILFAIVFSSLYIYALSITIPNGDSYVPYRTLFD